MHLGECILLGKSKLLVSWSLIFWIKGIIERMTKVKDFSWWVAWQMGGLCGMNSPSILKHTQPYIRKPMGLRGLNLKCECVSVFMENLTVRKKGGCHKYIAIKLCVCVHAIEGGDMFFSCKFLDIIKSHVRICCHCLFKSQFLCLQYVTQNSITPSSPSI